MIFILCSHLVAMAALLFYLCQARTRVGVLQTELGHVQDRRDRLEDDVFRLKGDKARDEKMHTLVMSRYLRLMAEIREREDVARATQATVETRKKKR